MKNIILLILVFILFKSSSAQELPHYMTEDEKVLMQTYKHPVSDFDWITPPIKPVRTMAEWEPLSGVIVTWTSYQTILRQIVDYAQEECIVYIVCSDSNAVKNYLISGSVPLHNLKYIIAPFNSVWVRDYGPWCVYSDDIDSMYIVDWIYNRPRPLDDLIPPVFANNRNLPLYQMTVAPYDFVATGGNFMTDGHGTGFSSNLILNENPTKTEAQIDTMIKRYMGIARYIKMPTLPYDGIHHIDMHMKLLDEETLLVGQYPAGVSDGPQIELNLQYILNNFQTCFGRPFRVVRIPMPPDAQGRYPSGGGDYRTYTNSVILNKTVIVPTYAPQYDTTALRIYRETMPGYNIVGINCNQMITALGAIHCITKEIGVDEPVFISHPKILTTANSINGYAVKSVIKSRTGIAAAAVYWSVDTTLGYNSIPMNQISQDTFSAYIPLQSLNKKVFYYISAASFSGRTGVKPLTSPRGSYQFIVDSIVPVELNSFTAAASGENILLQWTTGSEVNNRGFEIDRTSWASQKDYEWSTIGYVEGFGNSPEPKTYSFRDEGLTPGQYSYRLKQIDFDGTFEYSKVINVEVTVPEKFALFQNYPNPFNPGTKIKYSIPDIGENISLSVNLRVYDVLGSEIATLLNEEKLPGIYEIEFSAQNGLPSGTYFYRLSIGDLTGNSGYNFVETKKMLLLK